ncbi:hypothetical protein QBC42DRAFT_277922 [Cladorrhinum samala]|uniref:Uncharacterized protein n=1 Tax=Cladorrhinum samala TaxID=585594 RepID=A0AAV9HCI0_9PEZI|nr:hypothetical protein QBC42DRAFT_277922 [Cladorrhinum samala]
MPLLDNGALISLLGVLFAFPPAAIIVWKCLPRGLFSAFRTENRLHDASLALPLHNIPPGQTYWTMLGGDSRNAEAMLYSHRVLLVEERRYYPISRTGP